MDRLSGLTDEVIIHILSFLVDPKMLLQTSVLAKAWRFHWSRVPGFGFAKPIINPNPNENYSNTCFHIGPATSNHEFESWIATVFARNIRYLVIHLYYQLTLPACLFTSETLLYLRILDCGDIPSPAPRDFLFICQFPSLTVYFPALKKIHLVNVKRESYYSLTYLLEGCPVLEELTIERMNLEICLLASKTDTITTLVIDIQNSHTVLLAIPSLRYLRLCVRMSKIHYFSAGTLPLLIEADIDLIDAPKYHSPCEVTSFLHQLYNVKRLKLTTRQLRDVPISCFDELGDVKFHSLTQLNLRADWRFITCFLKNANNLRVLTILHTVDHSTQHWMEPKQLPECLASNLETVNLIDFVWSTQHEFDMVKYILKKAKVLRRMEIICTQQLDVNVKLEAVKKFTMLEIGSSTCEFMLTLDAAEI